MHIYIRLDTAETDAIINHVFRSTTRGKSKKTNQNLSHASVNRLRRNLHMHKIFQFDKKRKYIIEALHKCG